MTATVLIVDDNTEDLCQLESLLRGHGLAVMQAANGDDALAKARLYPPDLVVTEILMPMLDGFGLCRAWKADDTLRHIPVVFYANATRGAKDERFALVLGADRFLFKPQEPLDLVNVLLELLEENKKFKPVAAKPLGEEMEFFRQYDGILFQRLEKKVEHLEQENRRLKAGEKFYRQSFEQVADVVIMIGADGRIFSVSPGVEKISGYKPQDFLGLSPPGLRRIFTPASFTRISAGLAALGRNVPVAADIYEFVAADGGIRPVEISGAPVIEDGQLAGIVCVARAVPADRQK